MAKLGDRVRDPISGFVGIVTGRAEFLYGCVQLSIAPQETKDGRVLDTVWLDEDRVIVLETEALRPPASAATRAGGPVSSLPTEHRGPTERRA
jgi:hypothetical protein